MKKYLIALFLIVFITDLSFAQEEKKNNESKFGINGGISYSKLRGNDLIEESKADLGLLIGISFEHYLNENFSIKTNLNFETKVVRNENTYYGIDYILDARTKASHKYLVMPIMVKYNFGNNKNFFVNGGPFVGFLLKASSKTSGYPDDDFSDLYKKTDFGLSIGLGTKIILNEKHDLNIEVRENLGLSNISDAPVYNDGTLKTNSFNLILNWDFGI
ncbi:MAG: PorT family protein [Flavobacteriaceae bacterium]|nr:PorT family protein [Flavobacteriaceae bacterium]